MSTDNKNITVAVGMSGGVDSSVAAALLKNDGYNVIGITMKTYDYMEVGGKPISESNCCDLNAVNDARSVANKMGFKHYVINMRDEFNELIVKNFIDEYLNGRTPNPCVICNQKIKFGILLNKAQELGAQFIATGHYARVEYNSKENRYAILRGKYLEKDQSYALWAVNQQALKHTMFPLGNMTKPEVRKIGEELGLINANKRESFEICFIPDDNYERFLKEREPSIEKFIGGDILNDGKVVGKHSGYPFYTIGQRRNIGAHKQKMYVTSIDSKNNTVTIGTDNELLRKKLIADNVNWVGINPIVAPLNVKAKVRYKDEADNAILSVEKDGSICIEFEKPKRAITPGQSMVAYDEDMIVCGGIIKEVL